MTTFIPKLVCFSCKFGWGYLNTNGYREQLKNLIPVTCSGKVDTTHIMDAFRKGADGVIILGCPEKECHFQTGNYQARKRILLLRKILKEFGVEPERLKVELNLDPEGTRIPIVIGEMRKEIEKLGPLSPSV
ncbi:MAG: hydrogenase iron-sulfur subunit [Deltaproteobacteria bacterium]|nr:hydrogenase iron-sulfur subunit [Deltaproteobacteria bacterium]